MPVAYGGILAEHAAVRSRAGIFDISHMGQLEARGAEALTWLERQLTNRVERLRVGEGQYTLLLNDEGGVLDDLIVYRVGVERFFLVVNASMADEDLRRLTELREGAVELRSCGPGRGGVAVQGPRVRELASKVFPPGTVLPERNAVSAVGEVWCCGTGYTGEDGFELFGPGEEVGEWWDRFAAAGVSPCGLGARDSLRLEMGYPLNGADLSPDRTPLEAGLGFSVDLDKGPFPGRETLLAQRRDGLTCRLTGIAMEAGGPPPRAGYALFVGDAQAGTLTSGGLSPSLGHGIGMSYLPMELAIPGKSLALEVRGKRFSARTVRKPFFRREKLT